MKKLIFIIIVLLSIVPVCSAGVLGGYSYVHGNGVHNYGEAHSTGNYNPCTNGTYPKPKGCFQEPQITPNGDGTGNFKSPNLDFNYDQNDIDGVVDMAIGVTQDLIEQEKNKNAWRMSQNITNSLKGLMINTGNYYSMSGDTYLAEKFWRTGDMINISMVTECMKNKMMNDPVMYEFVNVNSSEDAMFGLLNELDQCTPYFSIPH